MTNDPRSLYKTPAGYDAMMAWYDDALSQISLPHESQYVTTRYGRTHVLTLGDADKPPLVLVQGYGASAPLWHKQFEDFAREYRLYALDTNGHPGRSDPHPPPLLGDGYAHWLIDVLDGLRLERPRIGGVCLGGWTVLRLGVVAPERIHKAVLLSPVGLARFKVYVRSGVPLILNLGSENDIEAAGQRLLVTAFTPPGSNLTFDRQLARALMLTIKHFRIGKIVGFEKDKPTLRDLQQGLRTLNRFLRGEPDSALRQFAAPALLMVGQYEAIYNPQAAVKKALRAIPHLKAEIVPETGHAAIYDRPDYVNPRVLDFLRD